MRRRKGNEKMGVKRRRRRKDNAPIYSALPLLHTQKWDPCFSSPSPKCDAAALLGAQSRRHIRCFEFVALFLSLCNSASSSPPSFDGFGGGDIFGGAKKAKGVTQGHRRPGRAKGVRNSVDIEKGKSYTQALFGGNVSVV